MDSKKQQTPMKKEDFPDLLEIKRALPSKYFEASLATSMYYVIRSAVLVSSLGFGLYLLRNHEACADLPAALKVSLTLAYIFLQGTVFWGIFTLGHDCGHGSFSRYPSVNWVMGNILHSFILTPYEAWRISHRHHHKNTGNVEKDEVFFPMPEDSESAVTRHIVFTMGLAWFLYLVRGFHPRNISHIIPTAPLFRRRRSQVLLSLGVWAAMFCATVAAAAHLGAAVVAVYYGAPLVVFASWLVVTTFLHHQDEDMPWYTDSTWSYVAGNLSSVDRDYTPFNNVIHNIGTHQIHHLFPVIPHYHLVAATSHFRKRFPELARVSGNNSASVLAEFVRGARAYAAYGVIPKGWTTFSIARARAHFTKAQ